MNIGRCAFEEISKLGFTKDELSKKKPKCIEEISKLGFAKDKFGFAREKQCLVTEVILYVFQLYKKQLKNCQCQGRQSRLYILDTHYKVALGKNSFLTAKASLEFAEEF